MVNRISHWIDGSPVVGTSGRVGAVFNPATGTQTGVVDLASHALKFAFVEEICVSAVRAPTISASPGS